MNILVCRGRPRIYPDSSILYACCPCLIKKREKSFLVFCLFMYSYNHGLCKGRRPSVKSKTSQVIKYNDHELTIKLQASSFLNSLNIMGEGERDLRSYCLTEDKNYTKRRRQKKTLFKWFQRDHRLKETIVTLFVWQLSCEILL